MIIKWSNLYKILSDAHCSKAVYKLTTEQHLHAQFSRNHTAVIAKDKALFSSENCWYLSYFSMKTYVVGTH